MSAFRHYSSRARPYKLSAGWLTTETLHRSLSVIAENCRRLAADEPLLHRVV